MSSSRSILGPTLFLLYINVFPDGVICNIAIYADDISLYSKCDQASNLWQQLELVSELEFDLGDTALITTSKKQDLLLASSNFNHKFCTPHHPSTSPPPPPHTHTHTHTHTSSKAHSLFLMARRTPGDSFSTPGATQEGLETTPPLGSLD